jgi:hypothetical protein
LLEFATRWTPLDELRMGLTAETASLIKVRDALLPRLVCGKIRIPISTDADDQIGAVVEALA